jgi:HK97 family phage portal protein
VEYFYAVTRNGLHEMAMLREQPLLIPSADMFHIRWMPLWNSLLGSSRLAMVRESIGLSIGLEEHQARFVGQGARTGGVLSTDQKFASKEVREQVRAEWQRLQAGPRNSGATAILEQGLKWQALGLTMVDSQFIESRNFQIRDIARAFGVPPYKLAIEGETEGPAMVQMGQEYLNGPISGYCDRWKSKGEKFFGLDGVSLFLDWDYGHFLKADLVSRFAAYRQAIGGPWMEPNAARRAEGMADVEGGDKVLQAVNMVPLGTPPAAAGSGKGPGSDTTGVPGQGGDGDAERNPADDAAPGV